MGDLPFPAEPLSVAHGRFLQAHFAAAGKRAWCYFAPFLYSYSLPPGRVVYLAERGESTVLLVQSLGRGGRRIDLVVPPVPMDPDVLARVMDDLGPLASNQLPRIHWVDAQDAAQLDTDLYDVEEKEAEYVYDPKRIWAAEGSTYRDLRKRVRRFQRESDPAFRDMREEDLPLCDDLLRHWRRYQGRKHPFLLDWGYTRAALSSFARWESDALRGWCVEVGGSVAAFALAGPMLPGQASFFIAKTDPNVYGLSEYLRWKVMGELRDYDRVNDAGDLGLPGLRQYKRKLRPVEEVMVYKARMKEGVIKER